VKTTNLDVEPSMKLNLFETIIMYTCGAPLVLAGRGLQHTGDGIIAVGETVKKFGETTEAKGVKVCENQVEKAAKRYGYVLHPVEEKETAAAEEQTRQAAAEDRDIFDQIVEEGERIKRYEENQLRQRINMFNNMLPHDEQEQHAHIQDENWVSRNKQLLDVFELVRDRVAERMRGLFSDKQAEA